MSGEQTMVTVTIDDREVTVPAGTLIIRAAEQVGIYIPRFCDHPLLDPLGACRQCLVEVEGQRKPLTACTTTVADGMVVKTQASSDIAREGQDGVLELLLINHPLDCPMCDKGGECPLQDQALAYGPGGSRYIDPKRRFTKPVPISPLVKLDRERCVLCARCTRFADQISGDPFIELFERGALEQVAIFEDEPYQSAFSGNVTQICPVGALTSSTFRFRARPFDMTTTPSTCNRCASGCAIEVQARRGRISRVLAREDHGTNDEWICDKGRFGYPYVHQPERVTEPLIRKGDEHVAVSWSEAFRTIAERVGETRAAGKTTAVLTSGQLLDEDAYAVSRFARAVLGTNDVAVLGADAPDAAELFAALPRTRTAGYDDIDQATVLIVAGVDLQHESPIVFLRVRKNQRRRGMRVIEVGPRRTALSRSGAEWISCAPGGEAAVMLALAAALEERGGSGLDPLTRAATGERGAKTTMKASGATFDAAGLAEALVAADGRVVVFGGDALTRVTGALPLAWNIAVATGGRFGWVPRKAGARGAAAAGLHPALLPGGRRVADPNDRAAMDDAWGVSVPTTAGRSAADVLADPSLGALFLFGADPVLDHADATTGVRALDGDTFVIAVDALLTESARRADVILPAATGLERAGSLTGWDGVARAVRGSIDPAGVAQTDVEICAGLAQAFDVTFPTPEALRREMNALAGEAQDPRPLPVGDVARPAEADGPVAVAVRRLVDDGAMMSGADELRATAGEASIEVAPEDAAAAGISEGAEITVGSERGEARATARINPGLRAGVVGIPVGVDGIAARGVLDPEAVATPVRLARAGEGAR